MLDRNNPKPLYLQLEDILRNSIANGEWKPNTLIPSENELSKQYGLSRMTVRSVITTLVKEGLLYRVQGKGTFVSEPKFSARSPFYMGIRKQLESHGYEVDTRLIQFSRVIPERKIQGILNTEPYEYVQNIVRVRCSNNTPISLHYSYLPLTLCPDMKDTELETHELCTILEKDFGLVTATAQETLESVSATEEEAKLLGIKPGSPLLMMQERNISASGRTFEYTKILFRGDMIKLEFEYKNQ